MSKIKKIIIKIPFKSFSVHNCSRNLMILKLTGSLLDLYNYQLKFRSHCSSALRSLIIRIQLFQAKKIIWVRVNNKKLPAYENNKYNCKDIQIITLEKLKAMLESAGISYFISEESFLDPVINIKLKDKRKVIKTLMNSDKTLLFWIQKDTMWKCEGFLSAVSPKRLAVRYIKIGYIFKNKDLVYGAESAIRFDFWRSMETYNRNVNKTALLYELPADDWGNPIVLSNKAITKNWRRVNFEIDAVYTWVDSNDQDWQDLKNEYLQKELQSGPLLKASASPQRYEDRDELKYSLRSLWYYAPFFRKIFIITNGQIPAWLNTDYEKVEIIAHEEIFTEPLDLPTFNSHAIEANLHHIKSLSEKFVYFNDDCFLGRMICPETFYDPNGCSKMYCSPGSSIPLFIDLSEIFPADAAGRNMQKIIEERFEFHADKKMKHTPFALSKQLLYEIEDYLGELHKQTSNSRFRYKSDIAIPSMLYHYYGWAQGRIIKSDFDVNDYIFANTGKVSFPIIANKILKLKPMFFCLNSSSFSKIDPATEITIMNTLLERLYPLPSPFEKEYNNR